MTSEGDLRETLAHHDAAIQSLGGRMSSLETGMRTLQGEVHQGFTLLTSKLDKLDAAPKFDFHQTTSTIVQIAVLFSMIVAGIIYIVSGHSQTLAFKVDAHDKQLSDLAEKSAWVGRVEKR